jgi:hypothetical protein
MASGSVHHGNGNPCRPDAPGTDYPAPEMVGRTVADSVPVSVPVSMPEIVPVSVLVMMYPPRPQGVPDSGGRACSRACSGEEVSRPREGLRCRDQSW